MTRTRNVVLLTIDALRADHVSSLGYHRRTTPNIDQLATENLLYENAYSVSSHTREAVAGILTGRYPDESVDQHYQLRSDSIPEWLGDEVDVSAAFHSNPFLSRAFGYGAGFDTFEDGYRSASRSLALLQRAVDKLRNRHYTRARDINEQALSWLDGISIEDSFFLWNHYMDTHGPYLPVSEYRTLFTDREMPDGRLQALYHRAVQEPDTISTEDRDLLVDMYDAEVRYTDTQVGQLLAALDRRGLLQETTVVVTADHGEAFGENGNFEHPRYLTPELTHVPLIVRFPGDVTARVDSTVSTLDILPTFLEDAEDAAELPGRSLREPVHDEAADRIVYGQVSGEGEESTIRRFGAWSRAGRAKGYVDLESEESAITRKDDPQLGEALAAHMGTRIDAPERATPRKRTSVPDAVERRLTALGYDR